MKRTMLAILALSPVLAVAQSKVPAQPQSTPVLQSANVQPEFSEAGKRVAAATASTRTNARVSTGVVPPVLVHAAQLTQSSVLPAGYMHNRTVGLSLTVGKDGKPTAVKVVKSAGDLTDYQVLSSINEYVYKPATLDGEAIPMDVNLSVTVE
jgi:hypothetical protein